MSHLLDTTVCIPLLNGIPGQFRSRYNEVLLEGGQILIPSIVVFELWYGVSRSAHPYANRERLSDFLKSYSAVIDFDASDAVAAGMVRAELERRKSPIGPMDTLIAGQALARGLTLVTANVREFSRVDGLGWQDWS